MQQSTVLTTFKSEKKCNNNFKFAKGSQWWYVRVGKGVGVSQLQVQSFSHPPQNKRLDSIGSTEIRAFESRAQERPG